MSKRVKGKTRDGQELWMITPNIKLKSFALNPAKVNFLELFYFFAQVLIQPGEGLTRNEEEKIIGIKKRALIEIDNKVSALKYFARRICSQEKVLIARKDYKKRIYDYMPYQTFLALSESYLNNLHSIYDFIKKFDELLGKEFYKDLKKETWFKIDIDLRNIFHHNQSPLLSVEQRKVLFTFERLPNDPQFFKATMKNPSGHYQVKLITKDLAQEMIISLNKWAKKYLDLIDKNEAIDVINGFHADGRMKYKKMTLKKLLKIAHVT